MEEINQDNNISNKKQVIYPDNCNAKSFTFNTNDINESQIKNIQYYIHDCKTEINTAQNTLKHYLAQQKKHIHNLKLYQSNIDVNISHPYIKNMDIYNDSFDIQTHQLFVQIDNNELIDWIERNITRERFNSMKEYFNELLYCIKNNITIQFYIGGIRYVIPFGQDSSIRIYGLAKEGNNNGIKRLSCNEYGYIAPHINSYNNQACFGNAVEMLEHSWSNQDYNMYIDILMDFIVSVNVNDEAGELVFNLPTLMGDKLFCKYDTSMPAILLEVDNNDIEKLWSENNIDEHDIIDFVSHPLYSKQEEVNTNE